MEDKKNDSGQSKLEGFFAGKGFYIVLFLCIAVIGVSAWTLLSSGKSAVQNVSLDDIELSQPVVATPAPTEAAETVWEIPEDAVEVVAEPEQPEVQAEAPAQQEQPEPVTEPQEADTAPASYVWPVYGQIEKPYAMTELIYDRTMADWRTHDGIDIEATLGGQVLGRGRRHGERHLCGRPARDHRGHLPRRRHRERVFKPRGAAHRHRGPERGPGRHHRLRRHDGPCRGGGGIPPPLRHARRRAER